MEKTRIREVIDEKNSNTRDEKYNQYVKENTPKKSWLFHFFSAFLVGGLICAFGQWLVNLYIYFGMDKETAPLYCTVTLVFLSVLFTGLNLYQKLAEFAGAGTLVPITGFANSVAAPAVEFKKEGQVFGIGVKIFSIAGPVILYGVFAGFVLGLIYWVGHIFGWS